MLRGQPAGTPGGLMPGANMSWEMEMLVIGVTGMMGSVPMLMAGSIMPGLTSGRGGSASLMATINAVLDILIFARESARIKLLVLIPLMASGLISVLVNTTLTKNVARSMPRRPGIFPVLLVPLTVVTIFLTMVLPVIVVLPIATLFALIPTRQILMIPGQCQPPAKKLVSLTAVISLVTPPSRLTKALLTVSPLPPNFPA